jgi:V/A-type H+-transporting ATPase subunit K
MATEQVVQSLFLDKEGALALGAAIAIGVSALGTAWAQASIGSSIMGVLAEKPEEAFRLLVYMALPEIIVLLGFIMGFLIIAKL